MDITLEYNNIKVKIPDIEDINKSKKKSVDNKINEALECFDEQKDLTWQI